MIAAVTAIYGALNGIINVALAANVSRVRGKANVFLGAGESPELALAIRKHGNNAEYVALALVLLLIAELNGGSPAFLHGLGGAFTLGRCMHVMGLSDKPAGLRVGGVMLTWLTIVIAGVYGAYLAIM